MGPRRMDGFARPGVAGARPAPTGVRPQPAPVRPQPMPMQRPMAPAAPMRQAPAAQVMRPAGREQPQPQAQPKVKPARARRGAWMVVLQFVVGLLVIAGVAAAIVWLYIKYYTQ